MYGSSSSEPARPPPFEPEKKPTPNFSHGSVMLGAHLGLDILAGSVPLSQSITKTPGVQSPASFGDISGPGLGYGLDVGVRFLTHWYLGLTLDHASLAQGKNPSSVGSGDGSLASDTTTFGLSGAYIAAPEKVSFLAGVELQSRWYNFYFNGSGGPQSYTSGELGIEVGLWLPLGRSFRLVPLGTVGFGSFTPPGSNASSGGAGHAFVTLGVQGFYNIDL